MAKNEPNKPDEIKTNPAKELQTEEKNMPDAEPTTEKVIPFDKAVSAQQAAVKNAEKSAEDKKEPEAPTTEDKTPDKKVVRKGRSPADKSVKSPKPEKTTKPPKAEKTATPPKAKAAADKGSPKKEETPPPVPEQPPEPREAPRKGEQEQIVYLNLSELHAFKDHPFQVRKDDEMAAMVESVKDMPKQYW